MNAVEEDIRKGTYRRVYLLCGEEDYLKDYYANALQKALIPTGDTINLNRYSGKEADTAVLISQSETLPFFSAHRLIMVRDRGMFRRGGDALAEYCRNIPETTVFLFVESDIDKRSRLFKAVRTCGTVLELNHQKADALTGWIVRRLQRENKQIQRGAVQLLLERAGDDMYILSNELNKLIAFTGEREGITREDVDRVCIEQLESKVFKMIEAAASGDKEKAFSMYRDLVFLREPPLRILAVISAHFRRLLLVRDLRDQGYDRQSIENRTGMQSFVLRGLVGQAEYFDAAAIRSILSQCASADEMIKTGRMNDQTAVEMVLVRICLRKKNASV